MSSFKRVICHKSLVLNIVLDCWIFLWKFNGNLSCVGIELSWRQELWSFKHILHLFHGGSFSDLALEKLLILFHWLFFNFQQIDAGLLWNDLGFLLQILVFFITEQLDIGKDRKSGQILNSGIEFGDIGICSGFDSHHHLWGIFLKDLWVTNVLLSLTVLICEVSNRVNELASQTIWAVQVSVVLLTQSSLVFRGNVLLLLELTFAMSERAVVAELASFVKFPVSAHLGLELFLEGWGLADCVRDSSSLRLELILSRNVTHIVVILHLLLVLLLHNDLFLLACVRVKSWPWLAWYFEVTCIWHLYKIKKLALGYWYFTLWGGILRNLVV